MKTPEADEFAAILEKMEQPDHQIGLTGSPPSGKIDLMAHLNRMAAFDAVRLN